MKQVAAVLLVLIVSSQSIAQSSAEDKIFEREQKMIGYGLGPGHKITFTENCEILVFDKASTLYRLPAASIDIGKVSYPKEGEPASAFFHAKSGKNFEIFNTPDGAIAGTPRRTTKIELFVGAGRAFLGAFGKDVKENYHIAFAETISIWVSNCSATGGEVKLSASEVRSTFIGKPWRGDGSGRFHFKTDGTYTYRNSEISVFGAYVVQNSGTICTTNDAKSYAPKRKTCFTFYRNGNEYRYFHDRSGKYWPAYV